MKEILIVDDEASLCQSLQLFLESEGFSVQTANNAASALNALKKPFDLMLLDVQLPDQNGMEVFKECQEMHANLPVIFMTAYGNVSQAVEAMKCGALDYLLKPFSIDDLLLRIGRCFSEKKLSKKLDLLEKKHLKNFVRGPNIAMKKVFEDIETIAKSPSSTVLIQGQTGSGKEIAARLIHSLSARKDELFVEINATALSAELLESELFGHVAGAFTGAQKTKKGLFELAHKGTLFLDEIGDMELALQAKILRALQEKSIRHVGGLEQIAVDVRLIAATHRNLEKAVEEKTFREDLYYRLNVLPIQIPSLAERKDDIESLAMHFIEEFNREFNKKIKGIDKEALDCLKKHNWPGNVRELRNVLERSILLEAKESSTLKASHLSFLEKSHKASCIGRDLPLETVEREHIEGVLKANKGNKNQAAQILGIDRTTLYNKLKKYSIQA